MFNNLVDLVELHLQSNLIEAIDKEAFYQLPKLKQILLQRNRLKTLANGLFFYLQKLEILSLYENPLTELPNVLFGKIDTLRSLSLWGTSLSTIPNFIFSNLTKLEALVLTKNTKLHTLPKDAFSGLTKLKKLYLYSNNLSSLPAGLFQDLQSLQILSLYNNTFGDLPDNLLKPLLHLQYIELNNSKLATLPENFFTLLPKLQSVHLAENLWICDCKLKGFKSWLERNTETVPNPMALLCTNPPTMKTIPVLVAEVPICPSTRRGENGSYMIITPTTAEHTGVYTTKWYRGTTPTIKYPETPTKRKSSWYEFLHSCRLPFGGIIYTLHYFITSMQIFLTIVQCFVLIKIRTFYSHFTISSDPVVLVHLLVPPNCKFSDPDK
ncbi:hypothetical protein GDO81_007678 [Engystomops pustulosus]|uniref:LRRCT domain-containing protein n=1 Tax=Engystomops pustulosus TaxID=76066 RepID=A0AAV7C9Y4_ENGPU|nr:hypothetical protein GDO81_007678 [Engystomops pustulosus]